MTIYKPRKQKVKGKNNYYPLSGGARRNAKELLSHFYYSTYLDQELLDPFVVSEFEWLDMLCSDIYQHNLAVLGGTHKL